LLVDLFQHSPVEVQSSVIFSHRRSPFKA